MNKSLIAAIIWTFAQLFHSLNDPSTADYVRRVAGHCGRKSVARFIRNLPNAHMGRGEQKGRNRRRSGNSYRC